MVSGKKTQTKPFFPHQIHYILTHVDNNYLSPKACHKNIGALEIKSLSLFLCILLRDANSFNTSLKKFLRRFIIIIIHETIYKL